MKEIVARALAKRVKSGDTIGLGSGSTCELALREIGKRIVAEGIRVSGVPTSIRTGLLAQEIGIQVLSPFVSAPISWAYDGADEVDPNFNMIKGRGAAILGEKIVARRAGKVVIIVTEEKLVDRLGSKFPVPVEVVPDAATLVQQELIKLGASEALLREGANKYGPVVTEHNNFVLDARFKEIPPDLEFRIKSLVGVVESGIFTGYTDEVLVVRPGGVFSRKLKGGKPVEETLC